MGRTFHVVAALIVIIMTLAPGRASAADAPDERQPVPPAAQLARSDATIKKLFRDDYARHAAADRQALARKLLVQGLATPNDAIAQYVCYREARDLATLGGDLPTAFTAINAMANEFAIDLKDIQKMKLASYTTVAKTVEAPEANAPLAEVGLNLLGSLMASDDYDDADRLLPAIDAAADKSKQLSLVTRVQSSRDEMTELRRDGQKAALAVEQLKKTPGDPEASLTLGRHFAFVKGSWDDALPLLAKSSDSTLKNLAQLELAKSTDAKLMLQLADGWWALAEKQTGIARTNLQKHAQVGYQRIYPNLAGADAARVAARIPAGMPVQRPVASAPGVAAPSQTPAPVAPPAATQPVPPVPPVPPPGNISRFWFSANLQPVGVRVWRKIDANTWEETNPAGNVARFNFISNGDPQLGSGMIFGLVGDPEVQVWVPQFVEGKSTYFRRTDRDNQWVAMGEIHLGDPPAKPDAP